VILAEHLVAAGWERKSAFKWTMREFDAMGSCWKIMLFSDIGVGASA
jgi:hypothetical protein